MVSGQVGVRLTARRSTCWRVALCQWHPGDMPRYEHRCRACGDTFMVTRPMAQSGQPAACPQGHDDTVRLLSTVALTGGRSSLGAEPAPRPAAGGGGGCCGGACGCG
jgi:putative FmdB family regulatory protein